MLKLSQKKRTAFLALAVAATILGANNSFAASAEHDKAISESNQYGSSMRSYWKAQGVYNAATKTYTFNEDISLKPKASEQDLNSWTPNFGGIYIAGNKPVTIDMQGHRLDIALNVDKPNGVNNVNAVNPNGIHVSSADLVINNVKGMELSASGSYLKTGKMRGIYVAGTNQEGSYSDGKGLASLTINNADGWDNAVKFHSSQAQVENAIEVWKNTGSADLKISGMVDLYVGNDSDVITVRGGNSSYNIDKAPTAYIGGGAIKAAMGRAANVSGGELYVNSKLQDGAIVAADGSRDVQVEGNILVKDLQKNQGILTLGMNTDKSYFKGTISNDNGAGDAYMLLANGAQWTNESKGDYGYHGSSLKQLAGGEADAKAGNIFQKDSGSLTIDSYSGNTNIFYAHEGNGEAAENYAAGSTVIKSAAEGSVVSLITDNTGIAMDNDASVANVLNALAGKLIYSNFASGEKNLTGSVKIADGLTASSKEMKTGDITFKEDGKGSYVAKPAAPAVKEYTKTLTGFDLIDEEYVDIIGEDKVYRFTQDSKITNQYGMDIVEDAQIDATGKTLTLVVDNPADTGAGIKINAGNSLGIKADTVKMELSGKELNTEGLKGINLVKLNTNLTVDGNLDITADGDLNTIGVYSQGNVVVNGDAKVNLEGHNGGTKYYGATGIYATSGMGNTKGGSITVNGNVDFQGNANGLFANAGGAVINVKGGSIVVSEEQSMDYAAIRAEDGTVNMNVVRGEDGNVTGADTNDVNIKGNVVLSTGAANASDIHGTESAINLGLTTEGSSLTGAIANYYGDEFVNGGVTFTGAANLWLQNGATWNNEEWGEPADAFEGSRVTNFVGGASEGKAGNIFQKDINDLTIDNYTGNTNIFYAHTGNGEAAANYAAGDTIIKHAAEGSVVSLITDNTGIAMDSDASVANVLNALAGKLTYSNFASGEKNLTGSVKIADGLTASSKEMKSGDITFTEEGKGSYVQSSGPVIPGHQVTTSFTTTLTGDKEQDNEYLMGGVIAEDGTYKFTKASDITAVNAIDTAKDLKVNAAGTTLSVTTMGNDSSAIKIINDGASKVDITADKLVIKTGASSASKNSGIYAGDYNTSKKTVNINGAVDITATNTEGNNNYVYGILAANADVTVNGSLKANIDGGKGGYNHTSVSAIMAQGSAYKKTSSTVTVNGDVDITANGNGLHTNGNGSVITVNGGGAITINDSSTKGAYAAMRADNGTINMNVALDGSKATAGLGKDVVLKGNLAATNGTSDAAASIINVALDTEKSALEGVAYMAGNNSQINMWLQNGASWTNEVHGSTESDWKGNAIFKGSQVTNFVGGASDAKAGNIFQKDSNSLTIDNYSGNTNIFYAHEGNGEAAENYKAGDTIIKHAAEDSVVSLITDNTGISMDSDASVANVLNALAGKLTYSNFASGEKNLTGAVKIADGLTASSKELKTGDITFTEEGKGSYVQPEAPVIPPKTEFTTTLTGDTAADTEYAGNIQDGKYVFAADTTVKADANSAVDVKTPLTIEAGSNKLVLTAKKGSWSEVSVAFNHDVAGTTKITAGELVIGAAGGWGADADGYDRSGLVVKNGNVDITAATTTVHAHSDATDPAYGILAQNNGSRVDIHGDLKLANDSFEPTHGLWAEDAKDWGGKASIINVDGKVDINLKNGNALTAIRTGSTVTVGGGNIQIANDAKNENYALKADGGNVNVNMKANKLSAGTTTTVIKGNAIAYSEKANSNYDYPDRDSVINIGLSDKASSWTGVAFSKDLGTTGNPYKGIINLYVSNGATWNNEAWGKTNDSFAGSHVAKFIGGNSEAAAGNIFQKDSNNLTIDAYRGNTNIFYAHEGNGEAAENYKAGDTIITSAVAGSVVNMITDNTGIDMNNDESVANVLNALAGKLTYSNFTTGETNLTGYAKIADGLTSSSQTLKSDTIKFNKDTGKGGTKEDAVNPGPGGDDSKNTFTDFISGEKQSAYNGVQQDDSSYVFTEDATIKINQMTSKTPDPDWEGSFIISGAAVQNAAGVENLVIKAEDKTLKLNVALDDKTVPPDKNAGILNNRIPLRGIDNSIAGSTTSVTAGTLDINIDNTYSRKTSSGNPLIGEGSAIGIYAKSAGEKAAVEVTGNTAIKAHGYNNVYGVNANGNAEIKLHGDLTMAKDGEDWAIDNVIKGQNTTTLGESSWRNIAGINANGAGANVTVDGKTTIAAHGSGVVAADGATVNLGVADIEVKNNSDEAGYGFHAVGAALGTVNVGDEGKTVTVKGNAGLFGKQGQKFASDSKESVVNLKLTTEDSSWTGVAYKYFTDAEKEAGLSGSLNLTLANGASWTNEKYGYVYGDSEWEKYKFSGSEIANFVGGASDAKAGNIFQKDSNSLTIDNYSGNTNIFYAHTGNGEAASDFAAGDTVIKHAEKDSVVSLITDNTDIAMDNQASVSNVLNALAGKLTYSNFVNGEKNLTGFVKIADGLTASSAALKTGDITFNEADGKGGFVSAPVIPDHQVTTSFTTTLTGDKEKDNEYLMGGVIAEDGTYKFTEASDITAVSAINTAKDLKIDATGKTLTVNTAGTDSAAIKILNDGGSKVDITADKLVINSSADYAGKNSGIYAGDWNTTRKNVTINGAVDITATNTVGNNNYVYAILASKADITVNGSLKANIDGGKGGYDHTSVSALIAQGSSYRKYASTITVNGDVDITANGNGLHANNNGAVVTVNGGGAITINDSSAKGGYAALRAGNGTVNMNVALENGKATGGLGKDVAIKGNLAAVKAGDQTASVINLALDTEKSSLEGVSYLTEGNGQINMWLQNGASWTNEVHGSAESDWKGNSVFKGSRVTNFVGGASDAKAGSIFQKDSNSLTIDNYSGNTNIFYAHTGNGEAASDFAAGDTIIKHAAEGSVVSLITDNTGINVENEYSVTDVLNNLAGKLTYSNFVNGEKNLTGYVKIADGLTASSKAMQAGNIAFNAETGKGSLENGSLKPGFTYPDTQKPESTKPSTGITGNSKTDYEYKQNGILQEDGSYKFTEKTEIKVETGSAVSSTDKEVNISTSDKLTLKGESEGINAEGNNVNISGNTEISGNTAIAAEGGNVMLNGGTTITGKDAAINAGAGSNVTISGQNGSLNSAVNINGAIVAEGAESKVSIDSSKATGTINGDINATKGGNVEITLNGNGSTLTGGYNIDDDSTIVLNIQNGATWELNDFGSDGTTFLMNRAGAGAGAGVIVNGGATEDATGHVKMNQSTDLNVASWNGWERVAFKHNGDGSNVSDYVTTAGTQAGNVIIAGAAAGSGIIMSTDSTGINMNSKNAVEAAMKALAQKVTYTDHEANGANLTGKVQIAAGLTASDKTQNIGTLHWDEHGKGQYDLSSVDWSKITEGDYETFVMKGVRSAATTSMHTWRDNMQDTYTGADLADEDGMFAKALGGKTSSDVSGLKDSNSYYGVQVGYDKALANGWHTGIAFDYRDGDSNYLLGGKGDNQMYSFGVYGVKNFDNNAFFRVAAKVGRVENEYDVYNEIRSLKLHGDYKSNAYGLTMEVGKTFGTEETYFTPKAQLTWSQVGAKDYTASTGKAEMQIEQDSYSSFVGRMGFEAGIKSAKGRVYAGLFAAHEFNGDISANYFANDGNGKHTSFTGEDTWMEMKLGGTYDFSKTAHLYADIAKDFGGDFERKWKLNAGLRFEF
ncbi:autotransporter outer membrane beta-barrel domain-containing protein [uncultured Phascolarctobacterium sp.]|uniref:autotransporter outer membrane beta-barrel domain-containing protein n=1 Tax=uncultured Phascolarctobacterium sp. TaxID=512296 RepID=UPI0025DBF8BA|nr:autotransporter outer membrane beta-barrel domain-containing protein [uncultured Phascolarctobacterium sp.]